jgi:hypothetical protein
VAQHRLDLGVFAAIAIRPVANAFGGGPEAFLAAASVYGVVIAVPWFAIWAGHRGSGPIPGREAHGAVLRRRPDSRAPRRTSAGSSACSCAGASRWIWSAAMLILYFTLWLGRSEDFELTMGLFFVSCSRRCRSGCGSPSTWRSRRCS